MASSRSTPVTFIGDGGAGDHEPLPSGGRSGAGGTGTVITAAPDDAEFDDVAPDEEEPDEPEAAATIVVGAAPTSVAIRSGTPMGPKPPNSHLPPRTRSMPTFVPT